MAKNNDFHNSTEVEDIMKKFIEKYPTRFIGFQTDKILTIFTNNKNSKRPARLLSIKYPIEVYVNRSYLIEIFSKPWQDLTQAQKHLQVFHLMCQFPDGAFDETSSYYGKIVKPNINMFLDEFVFSGNTPNWLENSSVADPLADTAPSIIVPLASDTSGATDPSCLPDDQEDDVFGEDKDEDAAF